MNNAPVDLDTRRSAESRMATVVRRYLLEDHKAAEAALQKAQKVLGIILQPESVAFLSAAGGTGAETDTVRTWRFGIPVKRRNEEPMVKFMIPETERSRPRKDARQKRSCRRCNGAFWSEAIGERVCRRCKGSKSRPVAAPVTDGPPRR